MELTAKLTAAEQRLWDTFASGDLVHLGDGDPLDEDFDPQTWGEDRTIRAEVIAKLMLGAVEPVPGQSARVNLAGAHIVGQLNLNGGTMTQELTIIGSYFDTAPDFGNAVGRSIWFDSCRMPGFGGWSMEISNTLGLLNCWIDNLQLRSTRVGLDVELTGLRVGASGDTWSMDASGMVASGSVRADGLRSKGSLNLTGVRVGPVLDLTGAAIEVDVDVPAMVTTGLVVDGLINATELRANGLVDFIGVSVGGALLLVNARICLPEETTAEPAMALSLEQTRIGQHLLASELHLDGQLNMLGTKVEGAVELRGATLHTPGAIALYGDQLQAGRFTGDEMVVDGQISLIGASFGRSVTFNGARVTFEDGIALDAMQISVAHNLELTAIRTLGGISIYSGDIGGDFVLTGTTLGPIGPTADVTAKLPTIAVDGRQLRTAKSVLFADVAVNGLVTLESATVGDLAIFDSTFAEPSELEALVLDDCTILRDIKMSSVAVSGQASAAGLQVGSDIKVNGMSVTKELHLANSTVQGDVRLNLLEAQTVMLDNMTLNGAALAVVDSQISFAIYLTDVSGAGLVTLADTRVDGVVDAEGLVARRFHPSPSISRGLNLTRATIAELSFDPVDWPPEVTLDGLRYEKVRDEKHWRMLFSRAPRDYFRMQPYSYLASYFRGSGHDDQARKVMLAAQRAHRRSRRWPLRLFGWMMDAFAGYGYAPGRALAILIGAWGFGVWWFRDMQVKDNAALYSADLIIPTSPFGLEQGNFSGVEIVLIAIGWALSIAVLPAVTRSLGRN